MKFTQRLRAAVGNDADRPDDETARPELPPRGAPVAAYAGILDGETLWLALEPTAGRLALREVESGEVVVLESDVAESDPRYRSVRTSLLDLPGAREALFEAVVVASVGARPKPVWTPPLPAMGPVRIPPTRDGALQFEVRRAEGGLLRIHRRPLEPAAELHSIGHVGDDAAEAVQLVCGRVGDGPAELLMLADEGGEELARFPLERDGDTVTCRITADALPPADDLLVRLVIAVGDRRLAILRRANDLAGPQRAVLLPPLHGDDPEVPVLRFRYDRRGALMSRLVHSGGFVEETPDDHTGSGDIDEDGDDT